jgi:hypothetical protein
LRVAAEFPVPEKSPHNIGRDDQLYRPRVAIIDPEVTSREVASLVPLECQEISFIQIAARSRTSRLSFSSMQPCRHRKPTSLVNVRKASTSIDFLVSQKIVTDDPLRSPKG